MKRTEAPRERVEAALSREFNLGWPGGKTVNRHAEAIAAYRRVHRGRRLHGFWCFWLVYVNGFDPRHHCKRCLKGKTSAKITRDMALGETLVLDESRAAPFLYLCGVSEKLVYERNLHIPMRPAKTGYIEVPTYNGLTVRVSGAEQLPIPELPDGWRGLGKAYTTCRNFRFGVANYPADAVAEQPALL